jgi:hypothetical protein
MIRVLSTFERLDDMVKKLSSTLQRPVYVVGNTSNGRGHVYRRPGADEYQPMDSLALYLSGYEQSDCVRRVDDGESKFYYDLIPPTWVSIVFPRHKAESNETFRDALKDVGLSPLSNPQVTIWLLEEAPPELRGFVVDKLRPAIRMACPVLSFFSSETILYPAEMRHDWHPGLKVRSKYGPPFVTLQAPGQYGSKPLTSVFDVNIRCLVDCDAGPCVVCRGASGDRRHIADLGSGHPEGHICRSCAHRTFEAWEKLLTDTPTVQEDTV